MRVAGSFRAPGVQGRLLFSDEVSVANTEDVSSVETGPKPRLWRQGLHLDVATSHLAATS